MVTETETIKPKHEEIKKRRVERPKKTPVPLN